MKNKKKQFDFGGWATKAGLKCTDGRIIKHGAFKGNDGQIVPLVWRHLDRSPSNVLGNALLEHRSDGTYCYCDFNDTPAGQDARLIVQHGDIDSLSIFANELVQNGKQVLDGVIREVSLVYVGANPGAKIEQVALTHEDGSEEDLEDEAIIYTGLALESLRHEDDAASDDGETVQDVFDSMTPKQQDVVYILISKAIEGSADGDSVDHSDEEGEGFMKHNAFEEKKKKKSAVEGDAVALTREQLDTLFGDAKNMGSLRQSWLAHADDYGIKDIELFFPDARAVTDEPTIIDRDTAWVSSIMNGTKHVPWSRIKSTAVDITADEARAKGYVTAALKKEEVIKAIKRTTGPTTVYKKQKLDKNDIDDITDFNVVTFVKGEMRGKLDEEVARAALVSDGRAAEDEDKIDEECIRPIYSDHEFYVERVEVEATDDAEDIIEAVIRSREAYRGTGTPIMYTTPKFLTDMLLIKDGVNRRIYQNKNDLMAALMVSNIIEVPVMYGVSRETGTGPTLRTLNLVCIIVNPRDYVFGSNKGSEIGLFDDFDIDYNQYKYLIETRLSGALVLPKSAIVIEQVAPEEEGEG